MAKKAETASSTMDFYLLSDQSQEVFAVSRSADSEAMHELYISVGREALEKATAALPEI